MINKVEIIRNGPISDKEMNDLREMVEWEPLRNQISALLGKSYAHFSIRDTDGRLIGFARVIAGLVEAFIVDVVIHPEYQRQGLGTKLVLHVVDELKGDGMKLIEAVLEPGVPNLEDFYKKCGFEIGIAGTIVNL